MQKFNLSMKLFNFKEQSSEDSAESVVYISSDEEEEATDSYDSDCSTDTDALINRIERKVKSSPILIAGRPMTTEGLDDEMGAYPSSSRPLPPSTPKLGFKYYDEKLRTLLRAFPENRKAKNCALQHNPTSFEIAHVTPGT